MNAESLFREWISNHVPLDFWVEETKLGPAGLEGIRATGECVATKPTDQIIILKTADSYLPFTSVDGFVFEWRDNPVDGFPVWIRTPSHSAWVALRPHQ